MLYDQRSTDRSEASSDHAEATPGKQTLTGLAFGAFGAALEGVQRVSDRVQAMAAEVAAFKRAVAAGETCDQLAAQAMALDPMARALAIADLLAQLPSIKPWPATAAHSAAGIAYLTELAALDDRALTARCAAAIGDAAAIPKAQAAKLFDAIAAAGEATTIGALRELLAASVPYPLDRSISDAQWQTVQRLRDAAARVRAEPGLLRQANAPHMTVPDIHDGQLSAGMSMERTLLRLEDMRPVLGVVVDPLALDQQAKLKTATGNFTPELARMTAMGMHTLRVEVRVPSDAKEHGATLQLLEDLVAHNRTVPQQPLRVLLQFNFAGGPNAQPFGLDAAERAEEPAQLRYLRALVTEMTGKPGADPALAAKLAQAKLPTQTLATAVFAAAARVLHKPAAPLQAEYAKISAHGGVAAVGTRFGADAGTAVQQLYQQVPGLQPFVAGVELGNEPEVQWKTAAPFDEATRDQELGSAAIAAFDAAVPGVPAMAAAHEWDPASEQALLREVVGDLASGPNAPGAIAGQVYASRWAGAIKAFAATRHGATSPVPLAIHVYNAPLIARAAIDALARIAADNHLTFALSITELQIDAYSHGNPTDERLALGVVELGTQIMDEVARHTDRLQVVALIAFSYHKADNGHPGQQFGLRGNAALGKLTG